MLSKIQRALLVLGAASFAFGSVACSISTEVIQEVEPSSALDLAVGPFPAQTLPLEGGIVLGIDVTIRFFQLLFGNIGGDVTVNELLITTAPFNFLGLPSLATEEICIVQDGGPAMGSFSSNIYTSQATFDVSVPTVALIGNEALAALLPGGGFGFPFDLQATIPLSLDDALGLLTGSGGGLTVTQDVDLDVSFDIVGIGTLPGTVTGSITLSSTDAFPTSQLLDDCIAFLSGP